MIKIWTIQLEPHNTLTNCFWFVITNIRTGKIYRHYAQEFIYGQMHYDETTRQFPQYIHDQVWELSG